jgi:Protein of unknown function (DUF3768)
MVSSTNTAASAELNDQLRKDPNWKNKIRTFIKKTRLKVYTNFLEEYDSLWMVTSDVSYLPEEQLHELVAQVQAFESFTPENDPYGERDFGQVRQDEIDYFWKINCYDRILGLDSVEPVDSAQTVRILFLIRADAYIDTIHPFLSRIGARRAFIDA